MTRESISLKFKTLRNSGILLHAEGQSEHSLTLELEKGKLLLLLRKGTTLKSSWTQVILVLCLFLIGQTPVLLFLFNILLLDYANILVTVVLEAITPIPKSDSLMV